VVALSPSTSEVSDPKLMQPSKTVIEDIPSTKRMTDELRIVKFCGDTTGAESTMAVGPVDELEVADPMIHAPLFPHVAPENGGVHPQIGHPADAHPASSVHKN
jgi:hypothetical protein